MSRGSLVGEICKYWGLDLTLNVWFQDVAGLLTLSAYAIEQGWLRPKEGWDRGLFWGFGLGLALFVAFRPWGVGTDDMAYSAYQFTEMTCPTLSCGSWFQGTRDTAWYSLVGFLRSLDPSPRVQLYLVAVGFLVKLWLIDRHVRHRCLSLLVYLALFFIIHELTALRLSLAIAVYLVALDALIHGRPLLGAFGVLLNGFFHKQAFVAPLVLLERWLDLTPLRIILALLLPMGLLMMGLYPGDGLLHWLLAQSWGGEVARLVFGGESYLAGGGYDQVRTWPVVVPPTVILAAWLIMDGRVLDRLHRVTSASLILAVLFLWAYAVIPEVQLRF